MIPSSSSAWFRSLLAVSAVFALGCADNAASVQIRHLVAPQANPIQPNACSLSNDPSSPKLLASVLDLALRDNYIVFPLVQNNLFSNRAAEVNRPDQRAIMAQYVDVELTTLSGALLSLGTAPSTFRVPVNGDVIPAGVGASPGFGVIEVSAIPGAQGQALRERLGCTGFASGARPPEAFCANASETIQVTLRPTFRTVGGVELTSAVGAVWKNVAPYTFPLTICCGCLLSIPAGYNDACQPASMSSMPATTVPYCLPGQDLPLACTDCGGAAQCSRRGC
jgi:sulfur carrier protein ThiS